jgi:hypothetical protein
MTNRFLLFLLLALPFSLLAQVPDSINYQGIARVSGSVVANQAISVTVELLNAGGTAVFQEVHTPTTNTYGVFNITIGSINPFGFLPWNSIKKIRSTFSYSGQNVVTIDNLKSVPFAELASSSNSARNALYADAAGIASHIYNQSSPATYLGTEHTFIGGPIKIAGLSANGSVLGFCFYGKSTSGCRSDDLQPAYQRRFSLFADGNIYTGDAFYSASDKRIKKGFIPDTLFSSTKILTKLNVINFEYIDGIKNTQGYKKGFIAQEVEQVFPEAVTKRTDFIPNIYQIGKNIKTNDTDQTLTVTVDSLDDLKVGDKIRLIAKAQNEVEVTAVEGTTLTVKGWTEKETKEVFVYGKQVNDFRVVDYDRIFTLNVSATQALIQEVDGLKAQIRALEAQNQALKKSNSTLLKKFDTLDSRLTQLEKATEKAATPTPVNGQGSKAKPKR